MEYRAITTEGFEDYELIDSGDGRKLERFGEFLLDRPDPQSLWPKNNPKIWEDADAVFHWKEKGERWKVLKNLPETWNIKFENLIFSLSLKQLKHIGIFPEHAEQWLEMKNICGKEQGLRVLNLFGYTGAASIVAASEGAKVTHVDACIVAIAILKENQKLSKLPKDSIRMVCEDAIKYIKRLISRKEEFDVIVMDPPAFGRGPKGEIWKIEEHLSELIKLIPSILSKDARLVILNGYAAGYSSRTFGELLVSALKGFNGEITYGDTGIREKDSERILSSGIYAKWQRR